MLNLFFYDAYDAFGDAEQPLTMLDNVSTSDVQMIKALLKEKINEFEADRQYCKDMAQSIYTVKDSKNMFWKEHSKITKKINKLAILQAKIKRNL